MFSKDYPVIPFIPPSWGGPSQMQKDAKAGCNISASGKVVAYSGPRTLEPGQTVRFQFDVALTPAKPLNISSHFGQRYYQVSGDG